MSRRGADRILNGCIVMAYVVVALALGTHRVGASEASAAADSGGICLAQPAR